MVTRKSSKPAARAVADEEVKSQYHDEVLNWLIDNIELVTADRWGMDSAAGAAAIEVGRKSAQQWLTEVESELQAFADGGKRHAIPWGDGTEVQLTEQGRKEVGSACSGLSALRQAVSDYSLPESFGDASSIEYEVMKPVSRIEARTNSDDKRIDAGFVDMAVKMFVPSSVSLYIEGVPRDRSGYHGYIPGFAEAKDVLQIANQFTSGKLSHEVLGSEVWIWMSVRTGSFTLGEVLQELKALRALESAKHGVALVVDGIDGTLRKNIEREGFVVVNREDYRQ